MSVKRGELGGGAEGRKQQQKAASIMTCSCHTGDGEMLRVLKGST